MTLSQANITQMNPNYGKFEMKTNKGKQKVDFRGESSELMCSCKDWLAYHLATMQALFLPYSGIIRSGNGKNFRLATYCPLICH